MEDLRKKISELDYEILNSLAKRRELSREVIERKDKTGLPLRDKNREKELLQKLIEEGKILGLEPTYITKIFQTIIEDSVRLQQTYLHKLGDGDTLEKNEVRVAIQGIIGSFSSLAARRFFSNRGSELIFVSKMSFDEVVKAVEEQEADFAMLPVENTNSGNINDVYDALVKSSVSIIGEEKLRVKQNLIGISEIDPISITKIYAHPQAAAQCSKFLETIPNAVIEHVSDTALSVQKIKEEGNPKYAAIASEQAAESFGVVVLKEDISNRTENYTRFLIAARKPVAVDERIPAKTSLVIATAQKSGALVEALMFFNKYGINMTKIQSRPIPGNPWEEMFYIDFEGNVADEKTALMLDELGRNSRYFKVFGSYPANEIDKTVLPPTDVSSLPETGFIPEEETVALPVISVKREGSAHRFAGREYKSDDTIIEVKGVQIGGGSFTIIGGPGSVESKEQILNCAKELKKQNGHILFGGCFEPKTSPYAQTGLGYEGLSYLQEAGMVYELPVATEIFSVNQVEQVAQYADILHIGAVNMQNFPLLIEVGKTHRPVLLKRGLMASIDELLNAAEYILAQGNRQVILCERGVRTSDGTTRNTLDLSAIPILKELTHLPVIVDPTHAVTEAEKIIPLAKATKVVGANGVFVEFHPEPLNTHSDSKRQMSFKQFGKMMKELNRLH
ncbi:MAG: bifunctional 3-deoxy-7-phosphoheptulonate synthase/chorismate mutase [Ignavibacteria bacterium]|nr:bifunctional 3-deoxy-7-phosphoheptulonate synthase/chorismate mutase [Ignavibacteria bacterium]